MLLDVFQTGRVLSLPMLMYAKAYSNFHDDQLFSCKR